jgi:spermidine synthase
LQLDRSFSSGITLPDGELLFPYTLYYKLYSYFHDASTLTRALVLGAGTGTVANKIQEDYPESVVDTVDIEPTLFTLSHEYFMVPRNGNIREHLADGRQFLRNTDQKYNLVFGDIYSSLYSLPFHVLTKEYYELLYTHLEDGGVYVGNYICSLDQDAPSMFGSILSTLNEVFDDVYVFGVDSSTKTSPQNIIIVGTKGNNIPKITKSGLYESTDVFVNSFADNFVEYDSRFLSDFQIFTDDLAPVEIRSAELIREADL